MQETSNEDATTIVAESNIKSGDCIVAYMGNLWSKKEFDDYIGNINDMRHLWAYDIPKVFLPGYKGPELIVEAIDTGNEARFLKDHRASNNSQANVESTIIYDDDTKLPYVIFCSLRNIKKGEEILLDWGEETWENVLRIHKTSPKDFNLWSQKMGNPDEAALGSYTSEESEFFEVDENDIESDDDVETLFKLKTPFSETEALGVDPS
jgi:hypothetical protein